RLDTPSGYRVPIQWFVADAPWANVIFMPALGMAADSPIRDYTGPVLVIEMADDDFAPPDAISAIADKFAAADLRRVMLHAETIGDKADHFRWARAPTAVSDVVSSWVEA